MVEREESEERNLFIDIYLEYKQVNKYIFDEYI